MDRSPYLVSSPGSEPNLHFAASISLADRDMDVFYCLHFKGELDNEGAKKASSDDWKKEIVDFESEYDKFLN
jgi:hypothetical protein